MYSSEANYQFLTGTPSGRFWSFEEFRSNQNSKFEKDEIHTKIVYMIDLPGLW